MLWPLRQRFNTGNWIIIPRTDSSVPHIEPLVQYRELLLTRDKHVWPKWSDVFVTSNDQTCSWRKTKWSLHWVRTQWTGYNASKSASHPIPDGQLTTALCVITEYHKNNVGQVWSWWRHQMETFSALLAICAGNSPVRGEFLAQRPVTRSFDVFICAWINGSVNNREVGDLRRYRAHYDVIVMAWALI